MEYPLLIQIIAIILFAAGIVINYIIARRKFNRRAITGAEGFRSYENAWVTISMEKIIGLTGKLMIVAGVVIFGVTVL